jgi:hypothetical protein
MPALIVKKELARKDALKSQIEYAGVKPFAPLAGGVTVFKASEKVDEVSPPWFVAHETFLLRGT